MSSRNASNTSSKQINAAQQFLKQQQQLQQNGSLTTTLDLSKVVTSLVNVVNHLVEFEQNYVGVLEAVKKESDKKSNLEKYKETLMQTVKDSAATTLKSTPSPQINEIKAIVGSMIASDLDPEKILETNAIEQFKSILKTARQTFMNSVKRCTNYEVGYHLRNEANSDNCLKYKTIELWSIVSSKCSSEFCSAKGAKEVPDGWKTLMRKAFDNFFDDKIFKNETYMKYKVKLPNSFISETQATQNITVNESVQSDMQFLQNFQIPPHAFDYTELTVRSNEDLLVHSTSISSNSNDSSVSSMSISNNSNGSTKRALSSNTESITKRSKSAKQSPQSTSIDHLEEQPLTRQKSKRIIQKKSQKASST